MRPSDLARLRIPSDPVVHGGTVAFVISRPDLEEDRYDRSIWVWRGDGVRRLTRGPKDSSPRWSPDGTSIAFLRAGEDEKARPQVAVVRVDGGEATVVTDLPLGVEGLEWSPDGQWLVAVAPTWTEGWEDLDEKERARRPRRVEYVPYRADNLGWVHDRHRHLWLVDPAGETGPRLLTSGEYDEGSPAWSPDGDRIAFLSARHPKRGLVRGNEVYEVEVATGEMRQIAERGNWSLVSYRPDGAVHLIGHESTDWPLVERLYRLDGEDLVDLTGHLDRSPTSVSSGGGPFLRWMGDTAFTGLEDAGRFGVVRVHPDGTVDEVVGGRRVVSAFDLSDDEALLAFTASEPHRLPELFVRENEGETQVTQLAPEDLELVEPEHFSVISGGVEIDAWAFLPPGEGKVPLLLNIHGGPASQYGFGFFDEFQVYAGAGYGVVAANPRGSDGRGSEFLRAVVGDGWGEVDRADIDAVVETALARFPRLDAGRLGVMGGSYGGFLTAWMTAHEQRWASAVVERALISFTSFAGTSDIGQVFPASYTEADYPDGWETWWAKSPLSIAHRVTTPTLVIHSEEDFRCPVEQGEQYFMALVRNGTPAALLRFPGEGHEMSRSGSPRHRLERFEAILDWHGRHLLGG